MRVLFKKVVDENYMANKDYTGTNKDLRGYIENISEEDIEYPDVVMFKMLTPEMSYPEIGTHITEVSTGSEFIVKDTDSIDAFIYCTWVSDIVDLPDSGNLSIHDSNYGYDWYRDNSGGRKNKDIVIAATGISPKASADSFNSYGDPVYNVSENTDMFEVEFDITKLNEYYKSKGGNDNLTYDNIGMGNVGITEIEDQYGDYTFNAILVYYSIYDSNKTKRLATNAYGIYLLDNSLDANVDNYFYYPSIDKFKSTNKKNGSSYSFRINVKPTTAYSGDIRVNDNSTAAYSMSEDFNDVLRNLTAAVTTLKENAKTLYDVVKANNAIKQLAQDTMEKVNDIETNVDNIKNGNFPYTASEIYTEEKTGTNITPSVAKNVLNGFVIGMDSNGNIKMSIDINSISDSTAKAIANSIQKTINNKNYIDVMSVVALLIARSNGTTLLTTTKQISSQHASINQDAVVNLHNMSIDPINPRYAYSE
jgi:tetrahydromethanopterin S-methyltransferase subunit B